MDTRLDNLVRHAERLKGNREILRVAEQRIFCEVEDLKAEKLLLEKVVALLHSLLDVLLKSKAAELTDLLSEGLRAIIYDQQLAVDSTISVKRNRINVDLEVVDTKANGDEVRGKALESFGGGVAAVQGILIRFFSMLRLGFRPLLVADEPLNALADRYVPNMGEFLRKFCTQTGVDLLMVTHKPEYLDYAHRAYEAVPDDSSGATRFKLVGEHAD